MPSALSLPSLFENNYKYERLKKPSSHIRLLEVLSSEDTSKNTSEENIIECRLSTHPLREAPQYEALSYTWGNLSQDRLSIRVLESCGPKYKYTKLRVTRNLYAALMRLRLPSASRMLWIDQICIDQSKKDEILEERKKQVLLMTDIYHTAQKTLIWLGDDNSDTPIIAEMLRRLPILSDGSLTDTGILQRCDQEVLYQMVHFKVCTDGLARSRREALVSFLNQRWFGRAWVYQEAVVSANLDVILGSYLFSFDLLVRLVYSTYTLIKEDSDRITSQALKRAKGYGTLRAMWDDRQRFQKHETLDLLYILWCGRKYLQASDPRDMVYSFLGVQNLRCEVVPEYGKKVNMVAVFTTLACNMIRSTENLCILQCVVPATKIVTNGPDKKETLPSRFPDWTTLLTNGAEDEEILSSWVPNWTESLFLAGTPIVTPGLQCQFNASRDTKHTWTEGDRKELHVKVHIIDKIKKVLSYESGTTYFDSLKPALKLENLITLVRPELKGRRYNSASDDVELRETMLRTLLMDGAYSLKQPIEHRLSELLRIYDMDEARNGSHNDILLHRYLRTTATVAAGKKLFVTEHLDVGLGYCNIREKDLVVLIHGCNTPCILRQSPKNPIVRSHFEFVGQCYVDGWMYGESPRETKWWEEDPEVFVLV